MKNRIVYFDYLRLISILAVLFAHTAFFHVTEYSGRSLEWNILNIYSGSMRWCVDILVMISGALFLSREIEGKKLYTKYIAKMLVCYVAWSLFYIVLVQLAKQAFLGEPKMRFALMLKLAIQGEYHMWFLPMIIGLYISVPILKEIIKSKKITYYFLALAILLSVLIPQIVVMIRDFVGGSLSVFVDEIYSVMTQKMVLQLVLSFPLYFILGYVLNRIELSKKQRIILYILGVIGLITTILLNSAIAWRTNKHTELYFGHFRLNVFLQAIAIHTWFKYREYKSVRWNAIVASLARYSFGAYLIHIFVIRLLERVGITTQMCHPSLAVPVVFIITTVISFTISWILHKMPMVNKWLV